MDSGDHEVLLFLSPLRYCGRRRPRSWDVGVAYAALRSAHRGATAPLVPTGQGGELEAAGLRAGQLLWAPYCLITSISLFSGRP